MQQGEHKNSMSTRLAKIEPILTTIIRRVPITDRFRKVLVDRFLDKTSLTALKEPYSLSTEGIRQLEKKALEKLHQGLVKIFDVANVAGEQDETNSTINHSNTSVNINPIIQGEENGSKNN